MNAFIKTLLIFMLSVVISGCALFQASPREIEQYRADFIEMFDKAAIEAENGQKALAEIRHKVDREGLKKTKALNKISDGTAIAKLIKDDVLRARIPDELAPIREQWVHSLDKRIEAYNDLFRYYDFMDEKYRVSGDALLEESMAIFEDVARQLESYRN